MNSECIILTRWVDMILNDIAYGNTFKEAKPFNHLVIDNFFTEEHANALSDNFPGYEDDIWKGFYNNELEIKKTCHYWSLFPELYYKTFHALLEPSFVRKLEETTGISNLEVDHGLHGGGMHTHPKGGKLNVHLDYHTHPKLTHLKRNLNLIIYLNKGWEESWGGHLQLWDHNEETNQPKSCVSVVEPRFNRAVLFDTTQNSWHGLPEPFNCPDGQMRKSLAVYYLTPATSEVGRKRAYFAPYKEQANDESVLKLIKQRADNEQASSVYVTKESK